MFKLLHSFSSGLPQHSSHPQLSIKVALCPLPTIMAWHLALRVVNVIRKGNHQLLQWTESAIHPMEVVRIQEISILNASDIGGLLCVLIYHRLGLGQATRSVLSMMKSR